MKSNLKHNSNEYKEDIDLDDLCIILKKMHLSAMAEELKNQIDDPNSDLMSFNEKITRIVTTEWNTRRTKKFNRLLKRSGLKFPQAYFDESLYDPERNLDTKAIERLEESTDWIDQGRNILITGLCGSGKTWFSNALAISEMHRDKTVRYTKASLLINEVCRIERLNDPNLFLKELNTLADVDILIIDDFGLMSFDLDMCRNLFEILDSREGRKSTIVISQLPVNEWYDIFQNSTYADACLDRLTGKGSFRLEFNGTDMRQSS